MARRPRDLRPDERALWDAVAAKTTPLKRPQPLTEDGQSPEKPSLIQPKSVRRPVGPFKLGSAAKPKATAHDLAPSLSEQLNGAPVRMDRKAHKKMTRGKLDPERRIDLHGMTLSAAHPALTRFILGAHASGCRLVLVITGKGRSGSDEGPIPEPRGKLKHTVPHWLSTPPVSDFVLQITPAHQRHGGAGAFYVYLRRSR